MSVKLYISAAALFLAANLNNPLFAEDSCFIPLFETGNLCPDPELTDKSKFTASWGSYSITTTAANVYCGTTSGRITGENAGSLTFKVSWKPNTKYVLRAMVKTTGAFQIGVSGTYIDNGSSSTDFSIASTSSEWVQFEKRFTTGDNAVAGECWFNNYGLGSSTGNIDNWELYEDCDLKVSAEGLFFDNNTNEQSFTVTATQLTDQIEITAPSGLTLSAETLPNTASGETVKVTFDGETEVDGKIVVSSGEFSKEINVKSIVNEDCFVAALPYTNLAADPFFTDASKLTVTGTGGIYTIIDNASIPYCGASCGYFGNNSSVNTGTLAVKNIAWKPNTIYKVVVQVRNSGTFNFGVTNIDGDGTDRTIQLLSNNNKWTEVDFTFVTGSEAKTGTCFFNNSGTSTAKVVYVDNIEIYELPEGLCD